MAKPKNSFTLIALDIEGDWNLPLLSNAAELSGADLIYAYSGVHDALAVPDAIAFADAVQGADTVLACESGVKARSIFDMPAPRGRTVLVVGNEEQGIPKAVLRQCTITVTIPMFCRQLSSINVAASGAVALYALSKDLGRKGVLPSARRKLSVDLLIQTPPDPAECGSLLRSAAAFGWRIVYLDDPHGSWLTDNRERVSLSRGAARREVNPIVAMHADKLSIGSYDRVFWCSRERGGTPLSRFRLTSEGSTLLALGYTTRPPALDGFEVERVYVDFAQAGMVPCERHEGSTLFAVLARQINRRKRG